MHALLLSGLGATYKNSDYFAGSLLAEAPIERVRTLLDKWVSPGFELKDLGFI